MNLRRHVLSASTSLEEPAMWRNVFPCDQPAVQGNDFELIPTVTIESRHSVDGPTGRDFVSIYRPIVRELWGPEVRSRSRFFQKSCLFEKTTHYGEIFNILFWNDSPPRGTTSCVEISWNLADRKSVKSRVAYHATDRICDLMQMLTSYTLRQHLSRLRRNFGIHTI